MSNIWIHTNIKLIIFVKKIFFVYIFLEFWFSHPRYLLPDNTISCINGILIFFIFNICLRVHIPVLSVHIIYLDTLSLILWNTLLTWLGKRIIHKDIHYQRPSRFHGYCYELLQPLAYSQHLIHVHLFWTRIGYLDVRHLLVSNATPPPQLREHWPSSDHGPQSPLSELLLSRYTWYSGINPELLNVVFHCCLLCRPCRRRCWKSQLINGRDIRNKKKTFFLNMKLLQPVSQSIPTPIRLLDVCW